MLKETANKIFKLVNHLKKGTKINGVTLQQANLPLPSLFSRVDEGGQGVLIATRKHHQAILLKLAEEACGNSNFILRTQFITPR